MEQRASFLSNRVAQYHASQLPYFIEKAEERASGIPKVVKDGDSDYAAWVASGRVGPFVQAKKHTNPNDFPQAKLKGNMAIPERRTRITNTAALKYMAYERSLLYKKSKMDLADRIIGELQGAAAMNNFSIQTFETSMYGHFLTRVQLFDYVVSSSSHDDQNTKEEQKQDKEEEEEEEEEMKKRGGLGNVLEKINNNPKEEEENAATKKAEEKKNGILLVDVKAMKRLVPNDEDLQDDFFWIELYNTEKQKGWLTKNRADYIAFEKKDYFLVVDRKTLVDYVEEVVQKVNPADCAKDAVHRVWMRNDIPGAWCLLDAQKVEKFFKKRQQEHEKKEQQAQNQKEMPLYMTWAKVSMDMDF